MKKILILASVVAMVCVSNAASFIWGFASGEIIGPTDAYNKEGFLNGGTAYLYIGSSLIATASQDANFMFGNFDTANPSVHEDVSATAGQAYKLVLRTTDGKYEIVHAGSSTIETVVGMGTTTDLVAMKVETAYTADRWQTVAVPEPTSGLLLLLGMAGLALKRKRA